MITQSTRKIIVQLRKGEIAPSDQEVLASLSAENLMDELRSAYPFVFQERHVGRKKEVSSAGRISIAAAETPGPGSQQSPFPLMVTLAPCVVVNAEDNSVTGLSYTTRLTLWHVWDPEPGLAIKSDSGWKVDRTIDGWRTKPLQKRRVVLSHPFLRQHGWRVFPGSAFLFEAFPALRDGLLA